MLDIFGGSDRPLRLSEVSQRTHTSAATAHQKLITLVEAGWLERTHDNAFRLTLHANQVGHAALRQAGLGERMMPFLERLAEKSGHSASLALLRNGRASIVARVESSALLRAQLFIGASLSPSESASGRVLFAYTSAETRKRLRASGLQLADERLLSRTRRERFAISSGRSWEGIRAAAVPVFDSREECVAALAIVGPLPGFSVERARKVLHQISEEISQEMTISDGDKRR
jgi:DNA-binding IclR family transcriptional regulator